MKGLRIAFGMYSILPVPQPRWEEGGMDNTLCYFPLVGVVIGLALWGWMAVAQWLSFGSLFFAAVAVAIPIAISGGIHLDGLCDTCDGRASHQSREKKLDIMKDPNTGAFGVMGCVLYLLMMVGGWSEVEVEGGTIWVLCALPALSRTLSALFALTLPNARGGGLLATFTQSKGRGISATVLGIIGVFLAVSMVVAQPVLGVCALVGCVVTGIYYGVVALKEFGGTTGDLAGWFLQLCELVGLLSVVVGQKMLGIPL